MGCTSRNVYKAKKGSVSAHFAKARLHNVSTKQLNPAHINLDWRISKKVCIEAGKKVYMVTKKDVVMLSVRQIYGDDEEERREKEEIRPFIKFFFV